MHLEKIAYLVPDDVGSGSSPGSFLCVGFSKGVNVLSERLRHPETESVWLPDKRVNPVYTEKFFYPIAQMLYEYLHGSLEVYETYLEKFSQETGRVRPSMRKHIPRMRAWLRNRFNEVLTDSIADGLTGGIFAIDATQEKESKFKIKYNASVGHRNSSLRRSPPYGEYIRQFSPESAFEDMYSTHPYVASVLHTSDPENVLPIVEVLTERDFGTIEQRKSACYSADYGNASWFARLKGYMPYGILKESPYQYPSVSMCKINKLRGGSVGLAGVKERTLENSFLIGVVENLLNRAMRLNPMAITQGQGLAVCDKLDISTVLGVVCLPRVYTIRWRGNLEVLHGVDTEEETLDTVDLANRLSELFPNLQIVVY